MFPMKTRAVIFDLGSVLTTNEWPLVYDRIAKEAKTNAATVKEVIAPLFKKWCSNHIDEEMLWSECERRLGMRFSKRFTKGFWFRTYRMWSKEIKGTWTIAKKLHDKNIRLALFSNIIEPHVEANEKMGRIQRLRDVGFEAFVYSYEEKSVKPDPRIYKAMLKKLRLPAKDCIMIDDKLELVRGAEKLGMQGICFRAPEQLRKDLLTLGLI